MNFDSIKQFFVDYFNGNQTTGIIRFVSDVLVVCGLVIAFFFFIHKRINVWRILVVLGIGVAIFFLAIVFELKILTKFMEYLGSWIIGFFIIVYAADVKVALEGKQVKEHSDNSFNSKKSAHPKHSKEKFTSNKIQQRVNSAFFMADAHR